MNFETIMKISLEAIDRSGVNPDKLNPLIASFREELEDLKLSDIPEADLEGSLVTLANFESKQVNPNLVVVKWDAKFNVVDVGSKSGAIERFNNSSKAKIAKHLGTIKVSQNGTVLQTIGVDFT